MNLGVVNMINFERLKNIREDHDLSQEQMAKILHVKRPAYSLWELGINIIPLKFLSSFADYFNYSLDYVLGLTNSKDTVLLKKGINRKSIGNNIKNIRIKNNLSQENLANILGVTQACIVRYEKGIIEISTSNLYKLSKTFNISMNDLCCKTKRKIETLTK